MNILILGAPKDPEALAKGLKKAILNEYGKFRGGIPHEVSVSFAAVAVSGDSSLAAMISEPSGEWTVSVMPAEDACKEFFEKKNIKCMVIPVSAPEDD
ncbi:MAG TPA: hypothetical protein VFT82_03850 [Candidatus Paceibacterota bacterium]|nr:hypothetical protein [Candidatus Paceibacterota bacterium]